MQRHCKRIHCWQNVQTKGGNKQLQQQHTPNKMWKEGVSCQQFFRVPGWKRVFEVDAPAQHDQIDLSSVQEFFSSQHDDSNQAVVDAASFQNTVQGFDAHHSTVLPWLQKTGIATHLHGLKKDEIQAAIALPGKDEQVLRIVVQELETVLRRAHRSCFDGVDCMLTWPCQVILNRFQTAQGEGVGRTRAFDPHKQEGTLQRYFRIVKQFLCYLGRVATARTDHFTRSADQTQPEDIIRLTTEQRRQWHRVTLLARTRVAAEDDGADDSSTSSSDNDELQNELVVLLMGFVRHSTGAQRFQSALLSFCAMLAIKLPTGSWMEPGNFNSHLSAMIWVVQLLVFHDSAEKERREEGHTLELVKACCEDYLQQTVETPMGEILRWRLLLFHVSKNSVSDREATWDESEEIVTYDGTELHLDQIPTLLSSEYNQCRQLLYEDLLLGSTRLTRMHASLLHDNPAVQAVGWSFVQHRENGPSLQGANTALLDTIQHTERLRRLFLQQVRRSSVGYQWRDSALVSYEATVQQFLQRLCTLVHITSGQPLRENEFFSMTWQNTQRKRTITIRHQRVMIHTQYDKMQQTTGQFKENVRFLPHALGDMLLDYLVYVLPLRQSFLRKDKPGAISSPFLWEKGGTVWPEGRISHCLEQASVRAQIPRLHCSNWRQMTVAIVKTKFASQIGHFTPDDDDEDAEEMDADIRAMTRQRNHKTRTVNRAYANQSGAHFGGIWDGLIRMGLRASTLWQDFWGVDIIFRSKKREASEEGGRLTKRIAMGVYRPRRAWTADELLAHMRQLHEQSDMEWKSPAQCEALATIMSWSEQVVAILPTGAGKSMLFLLPSSLSDAASTILIVPLVALRGDLIRKVGSLGISYLEWFPGERREAQLVIVSVEAAASKDFQRYAQQLVTQQRLDRIVVDECHLTVTAAEYRPSMVELTSIRALRTQVVYLTATLPPSMWNEFETRNHLVHPRVVRASSNRANIFYMVRKAVRGKGSLAEQAVAEARHAWEESKLLNHARDKIILYTRTREEADTIAGMLGCDAYTSKSGTTEEKQKLLARWTTSPDRPYMVATTALAEGFDYPHVRFVMNVNEPESLILFAQESGRAGRDGEMAYSMVLLPATWEAPDANENGREPATSLMHDVSLRKRRDRQAMRQYLRGEQCFRTSLSEYLDVAHDRRWCMEGDVACNVCGVCHTEPVPPLPKQNPDPVHTGLDCIQQQKLQDHLELAGYQERLAAVQGTCLLCRTMGERWDHEFERCTRRMEVFSERNKARQRHEARGGKWLQPYTACFLCFNPQMICTRAAAEERGKRGPCEHKDIVLPLCYGLYCSIQGPRWIWDQFGRRFEGKEDFLDWVGEETTFGGGKAIQGIRVAAAALAAFDLLASGGEPRSERSEPGWQF